MKLIPLRSSTIVLCLLLLGALTSQVKAHIQFIRFGGPRSGYVRQPQPYSYLKPSIVHRLLANPLTRSWKNSSPLWRRQSQFFEDDIAAMLSDEMFSFSPPWLNVEEVDRWYGKPLSANPRKLQCGALTESPSVCSSSGRALNGNHPAKLHSRGTSCASGSVSTGDANVEPISVETVPGALDKEEPPLAVSDGLDQTSECAASNIAAKEKNDELIVEDDTALELEDKRKQLELLDQQNHRGFAGYIDATGRFQHY